LLVAIAGKPIVQEICDTFCFHKLLALQKRFSSRRVQTLWELEPKRTFSKTQDMAGGEIPSFLRHVSTASVITIAKRFFHG